MNWSKGRDAVKLTAIILWLIFTVTFALWWFKFSLENISTLMGLQPELIEHWSHRRRMILWEGGSWIVLLILGGGALIALVQRERRRMRQTQEFFASFSHEIKTSLASLRLQAEALKDEPNSNTILDRLIGDTVRLNLQLENSLFVASQRDLKLFVKPLTLSHLVERLREQWPGLKIELRRNCTVHGDERALYTILSNLMQNAIVHGGATQVVIDANILAASQLSVSVLDNGRGFNGASQQLGKLFYRPQASSGSGLGLYICRLLLEKMDGHLDLRPSPHGFYAGFIIPGSLS